MSNFRNTLLHWPQEQKEQMEQLEVDVKVEETLRVCHMIINPVSRSNNFQINATWILYQI